MINKIISGCIYTLSYDGDIFYVGATIGSLKERLCCHVSYSRCGNNLAEVHKFIKIKGIKPIITSVEECDSITKEEFRVIEYYWIDFFKSKGFNLKNYYCNNPVSRKHPVKELSDILIKSETYKDLRFLGIVYGKARYEVIDMLLQEGKKIIKKII
jgi:hypothetical protein